MGKYGASLIHEWFSDWHYKKCAPTSWLTDQDRLWVETRSHQLVAVYDLKWKWSFDSGLDSITYAEQIVNEFFEDHGIAAYVIVINPCGERPVFEVRRPAKDIVTVLTEEQFISWIDNGLNFQEINSGKQ